MGNDNRYPVSKLLRPVSLLLLLLGAAVSFFLTLRAGSHNPAVLLILLFEGWVLSPFAALLIAAQFAKRWQERSQNTLYVLTIVIALFSMVGYSASGLFVDYGTRPAFIFELVPLLSWLVIGIFLAIRFFNREHAPRSPEGEE